MFEKEITRRLLCCTASAALAFALAPGMLQPAFASQETTPEGSAAVAEQTSESAITRFELDVTYDQTSARSMLQAMNEFRTGSEAWYLDQSGNKKTVSLSPLVYDYTLEKAAMQRAAEIAMSFSHTRPTGEICFTAFEGSYSVMGENIAAGNRTMQATLEQWKETDEDYAGQGHRRNMLSSSFNAVGIGHARVGGVDYWVQDFGYASSPNTTAPTASLDNTTTVECSVQTDDVKSFESVSASPKSLALAGAGASADVPTVEATSVRLAETWIPFTARCQTSWASADETVARVSDGKVVGVAEEGTTEISAQVLGKTVTVPVGVGTKPATGTGESGASSEGKTVTSQKAVYELHDDGTATLANGKKVTAKTFRVRATLSVDGKKFAVNAIGAKAFSGNKKVTTLVLKGAKFSKKNVKGSLKGSAVKTVKVAKSQVKSAKKAFSKKNCGKKVAVKAI